MPDIIKRDKLTLLSDKNSIHFQINSRISEQDFLIKICFSSFLKISYYLCNKVINMRYCVLFVLVAFVIVQAKLTPEDRLKKLEKHFDYLLEDNESLKSKVSELEEKIESKVQDDSHRSRSMYLFD